MIAFLVDLNVGGLGVGKHAPEQGVREREVQIHVFVIVPVLLFEPLENSAECGLRVDERGREELVLVMLSFFVPLVYPSDRNRLVYCGDRGEDGVDEILVDGHLGNGL